MDTADENLEEKYLLSALYSLPLAGVLFSLIADRAIFLWEHFRAAELLLLASSVCLFHNAIA